MMLIAVTRESTEREKQNKYAKYLFMFPMSSKY